MNSEKAKLPMAFSRPANELTMRLCMDMSNSIRVFFPAARARSPAMLTLPRIASEQPGTDHL